MTTTRTHKCNLCCLAVRDGTGVGLRWEANNQIKFTTPGQAETHVCQACLDNIESEIYRLHQDERRNDEEATYMLAADSAN